MSSVVEHSCACAGKHVVQFYDIDDDLVAGVGAFSKTGHAPAT